MRSAADDPTLHESGGTAGLVVRPRPAPDLELQVLHQPVSAGPGSPDDAGPAGPAGPAARPPAPGHRPEPDPRPGSPARTARALTTALALSLVLAGSVNPPGGPDQPVLTRAQALAARTVLPTATLKVAGQVAPAPVRLIGVSEQGMAIWQGAPAGSGADPVILTGALTGRDGTLHLTARPGVGVSSRAGSTIRLSVAGDVLAWYELGGGVRYPAEHRLDLADGRDLTGGRNGSLAVRRRARGADATVPYTQIDPGGRPAADRRGPALRFAGGLARIVRWDNRWVLEIRPTGSGRTRRINLPDGVSADSGLGVVSDRLYTVSSGTHPAVHMIQRGQVTRIADIPAARYPIISWSLAGSMLRYTLRSRPPGPGDPQPAARLFRSPIRLEDGAIVAGTPRQAAQAVGGSPASAAPIGFSTGRGVLRAPSRMQAWRLVDGGSTTAVVAQRPIRSGTQDVVVRDDSPTISGAYTLVAGQIFRPDGELVWREPAAAVLGGTDALFGSGLLYSVPAGGTDARGRDLGGVWSADAERPLPIRLDTSSCPQAQQVALWATTAAWTSCDGSRIWVQDLRGGQIRGVRTGLGPVIGSGPQPVTGLALEENVLAWLDGAALTLLDLDAPDSAPVVLPGATARFELDGAVVARQLSSGGSLVLNRLPFGVDLRPRLISAAAPLGFTPDGDGRFDTWQPQFDVTRPVRNAQLRITGPSGQLVRRFTITGPDGGTVNPDGSLRGVSWDGRSGDGRVLPVGQYTWELTADALDGAGTLTEAGTAARPRGTVEISTTAGDDPTRSGPSKHTTRRSRQS